VLGAGNLFRGRSANLGVVERVTADHVGMLGTVMNAAVLRDYLRHRGLESTIFSPREQAPLSRLFARDAALRRLEAGQILIFAGGTGNPFFTTDSAAALRACEISADVLLKGTQVDGVYDKDPRQHADARRFDRLTYQEAVSRRLGVMDLTAITLCSERALPILVFDISEPQNLVRVLRGEELGTWIERESQP
jgi:uridylate kinase